MAHAEDIALVLLAAGRSARFGTADKLMARLGDRPLIEWAADSGRGIAAGWHLLVTSPDPVFDASALGYRALINPAPAQGLAASLRIAASEAQRVSAAALLVMLADMPFVPPAHLERLIAAFREKGTRPVFSRTAEGAPQPPALFPAASFPALKSMAGDKGARTLATDAFLIEAEAGLLLDIDTPDDLKRANDLCRADRKGA